MDEAECRETTADFEGTTLLESVGCEDSVSVELSGLRLGDFIDVTIGTCASGALEVKVGGELCHVTESFALRWYKRYAEAQARAMAINANLTRRCWRRIILIECRCFTYLGNVSSKEEGGKVKKRPCKVDLGAWQKPPGKAHFTM